MSQKIKLLLFNFCFILMLTESVTAQGVDIKYFGDLNINTVVMEGKVNNEMAIGDHALFFANSLNDKISFLGEVTVGTNNSDGYKVSVERAMIRFNIKDQLIGYVGKMHTPINYWNDVYHHGKVFFPTIDRPEFFQFFIPIHTLGIRVQNENIGALKFGYDLVFGDGISNSTEKNNIGKSITTSVYFKPNINSRIGLGFYYDTVDPNIISRQSGLLNRFHNADLMRSNGSVEYSLLTTSVAHFGKKFEFLVELLANRTQDNSSISSLNGAAFIYSGFKYKKRITLFTQIDHVIVSSKDTFTTPLELNKSSIGFKYEFDYKLNLKVQAGTCSIDYRIPNISNEQAYQFKVQISYGF